MKKSKPILLRVETSATKQLVNRAELVAQKQREMAAKELIDPRDLPRIRRGRPMLGSERRVARPVTWDPALLRAMESVLVDRRISLSEAVNQACQAWLQDPNRFKIKP